MEKSRVKRAVGGIMGSTWGEGVVGKNTPKHTHA